MTLLAALSAGLFVYLSLGALVGITPRFMDRSPSGERPRRDRAQDWLNQAGADVTPFQFFAVSIGTALGVAVIMQILTQVIPLTLVAAGLALWIPRSFYSRRRNRIARERVTAWPDALRDLVAHLKSSMSVHMALNELGRSGPAALRPYFNRYTGLAATLDQRTALEIVREDLADPVSDRVIEIVLVAFEQGSTVVIDILADLADDTAGDIALGEEIQTAQLEVRLEARSSAVLPFLVLIMMVATSNDYASFYRSSAGWLVIAIGGLFCMAGLYTINRLGRVPTEQRILASGGRW
ncbi:MAG: type II secretion system F family protein [Acidimicrobiia bacterium]|nr:type II secretion system F family protein [Acidimicrobiia bacterium]